MRQKMIASPQILVLNLIFERQIQINYILKQTGLNQRSDIRASVRMYFSKFQSQTIILSIKSINTLFSNHLFIVFYNTIQPVQYNTKHFILSVHKYSNMRNDKI